jgi:hypothetical protein
LQPFEIQRVAFLCLKKNSLTVRNAFFHGIIVFINPDWLSAAWCIRAEKQKEKGKDESNVEKVAA